MSEPADDLNKKPSELIVDMQQLASAAAKQLDAAYNTQKGMQALLALESLWRFV